MKMTPVTIPKVCFFINVGLVGVDLLFGMYGLAMFGLVCCALSLLGWQLRARGY